MKITHIPTRHDGGGTFEVTAETTEEVIAVCEHFSLGAAALIEAVKQPLPWSCQPPYIATANNGAYFRSTGTVERRWIAPYFVLLEKRVGDVGVFDMELTPRWGLLRFTHYPIRIWTEGGHLHYDVVNHASDWNGKTAAERAPEFARSAIESHLGRYDQVPEFLEAGNGLYRRNPRYGNGGGLTYSPAAGRPCIMDIVVDHWLATKATPGQRKLVQESHDLNHKNHHGVSDLHDVKGYGDLRTSWTETPITWEEFRKV